MKNQDCPRQPVKEKGARSEIKKPSPAHLKFMRSHELGRLGVAGKDGMPHVTPVIYAMD